MRRTEFLARGGLSATFVILAGVLLAGQDHIRQAEAKATGALLSQITGFTSPVNQFKPVFYVPLPRGTAGPASWIGLSVTPECTVAWLLAPFLMLCAALILGPRLRPRSAVIAMSITAAALVLVNLVRLSVIGLATHFWGMKAGYRWSHDVYGSIIAIVGICLAVVLFVKLAARLSRPPVPVG
jgi:exosortase/archaeosortase family protein